MRQGGWAAFTALLLLGFWTLLSGGEGWVYGVVLAALGGALAAWLAPADVPPVRPWAAVRFAGLFVDRSVRGGLDVAVRALHPDRPMDPTWVRYPLDLPPGPARALFLITVSLTPGTLCADVRGAEARIHVLSPEMTAGLRSVEQACGAVFAPAGTAGP